jgi:O-antigen ligase
MWALDSLRRSEGFMRLNLREVASVLLAASLAGLVWLPYVPSVTSAVFAAVLVYTLVVELTRNQEKLSFGTINWLVALFVAVRVLALWNEPQEIGGFEQVVSLVVSLVIFLSMALPQWRDGLARRVTATFILSATAAAAVHWWLSRGYVAASGSGAIGMELLARGINRNEFGQLLATAATLAFLFIRLHRHNLARRLIWATILVFDLAFLVELGSRASLAIAFVGLLLNLVIERPRYAYLSVAALACMVLLLPRFLSWIVALGTAAPETLRRGAALVQALMAGDANQIAGAVGRASFWQAGLASFADSPIWGVGTGQSWSMVLQQTGYYTYAHSTLVILLAESGLVGAILYYAFCLTLASHLSRSVRQESNDERHIAATLLAYELAILAVGVFVDAGRDKNTFMLLGIGAALVSRRGHERHGSDSWELHARAGTRHGNNESCEATCGPKEGKCP